MTHPSKECTDVNNKIADSCFGFRVLLFVSYDMILKGVHSEFPSGLIKYLSIYLSVFKKTQPLLMLLIACVLFQRQHIKIPAGKMVLCQEVPY